MSWNTDTLTAPQLLLDPVRVRHNITFMAERARKLGVKLIPHFKTHQSRLVGQWFKQAGVDAINVSSVRMAQYFAEAGWKDITIAFPANPRASARLNKLADAIDLTLFINQAVTAQIIDQRLDHQVGVYVEIDTGYRRSGVPTYDIDRLNTLMDTLAHAGHLRFEGFYCHNGQTYSARSVDEIQQLHKENLRELNRIRERWQNRGLEVKLSIGDTPSASRADQLDGVDSIRPGNFVFYDLMQSEIGSCLVEDIGVAVACPVAEIHRERSEMIIHGGAVHFSKDYLELRDNLKCYGRPVWLQSDSWSTPWPDSSLRTCSQEHGVLRVPRSHLDLLEPGDVIGVLPVHSCLTADAMKSYLLPDGERADHLEGATENA